MKHIQLSYFISYNLSNNACRQAAHAMCTHSNFYHVVDTHSNFYHVVDTHSNFYHDMWHCRICSVTMCSHVNMHRNQSFYNIFTLFPEKTKATKCFTFREIMVAISAGLFQDLGGGGGKALALGPDQPCF